MMQGSLWNLNSCTIKYHIMMQGSLWNLNCTIRSKITSHFFAFKTIAGCCVNKWYWLFFFCRTAALCNICSAKIRESAVTFANHVVVVLQKCHWYVNSTLYFCMMLCTGWWRKRNWETYQRRFHHLPCLCQYVQLANCAMFVCCVKDKDLIVSVSMFNLITVPCLCVVWKIRIC